MEAALSHDYWYLLAGGAAVMAGVCAMWARLISNTLSSRRHMPALEPAGPQAGRRVSVIVPARNEEEDIGECIRTLVGQDYGDYEVIIVDDGSDDATYDIAESFARGRPNVRLIHTKKPPGWMGKTWACAQAAKEASGEVLLFTDADTKHRADTLSSAMAHMAARGLDCLTLTERIAVPGFWVEATVPVITSFKLVYPKGITLYSAKRINDPDDPMGGLNGAYILITREAYDGIGGFESVRNSVVEDWAVGMRVKGRGYRVGIADGGAYVDAMWMRDLPTMNDLFRRLMLPFVRENRAKAAWDCTVLLALLFAPYPAAAGAAAVFAAGPGPSSLAFLAASAAAVALHMASYAVHAGGFGIRARKAVLAPFGGFATAVGFLDGLRSRGTRWRGRLIAPAEVSEGSAEPVPKSA